MNPTDAKPHKSRRSAIMSGIISGLIASFVVSANTPDGNLVVTTVPGLVIGFVVFGVVSWITRTRST